MGLVNWLAFSYLIIVNIANIHNDPPYWRDALWLTVNLGMIWQLALIWKNPDPIQRAKASFGAALIGVLGAIQGVYALWYYYMAKTEMFLSPILQGFCYWVMRGFMGNSANTAEDAVRKMQNMATVPNYWDYQALLAPGTKVANQELLQQVQQACAQKTVLDPLFQIIPTFVKDPKWMLENSAWVNQQLSKVHVVSMPDLVTKCNSFSDYGLNTAADLKYQGLVDYVVTNRWCWDYVNFCDRMNGVHTASQGNITYPLGVPELDWVWMVAGVVVMVLGFATAAWCKKPAPKPEVKQPAASAAG
jgi:hypothetical protein